MRRWMGLLVAALVAAAPASARAATTNAMYFNDASLPAADPYVLYDPPSHSYYAYSTEGADDGSYFGVYRSADLVTWKKLAGGALPVKDAKQWGNDWFWAPEVYRNPKTGLYFLFYAARSDANKQKWFGFASFEEPCKIGVAVSRSPAGPFHNIADQPIDYNPYDPDYHDVNQIMGPDQKVPPATQAQGETAPLGVYIPTIDPDVYFAKDGRQYLFYSRNAYRNWVWDDQLGKYIESSDIGAVELTTKWWNDPKGRTMPTIAPKYRGANNGPGGPAGPRRDGWVQILSYKGDPQSWENADVNDYALTGGQNKDRRWEEGSTTFAHTVNGRTAYYLTYSANNWQSPFYGVGYAVADSPLGPYKKAAANPILTQNAQIGLYGPGHGSLAFSPDGREMFYVHHGRPTPDASQRRLYTNRMTIDDATLDSTGHPALAIHASTSDEPVPSGVAPYRLRASTRAVRLRRGGHARLRWRVTSAAGAPLALKNPLNRVLATVADPRVATVTAGANGARVTARRRGRTTVTLVYQRKLKSGGYRSVRDNGRLVARRITVTVR
jgi:GH43 family beta-xylosidase